MVGGDQRGMPGGAAGDDIHPVQVFQEAVIEAQVIEEDLGVVLADPPGEISDLFEILKTADWNLQTSLTGQNLSHSGAVQGLDDGDLCPERR